MSLLFSFCLDKERGRVSFFPLDLTLATTKKVVYDRVSCKMFLGKCTFHIISRVLVENYVKFANLELQ